MAVDDYIFRSLREEPKTYLRFYMWEKPTVSLGYSQNIEKVVDVEYCQTHGIDIVRRMTGGKLVLHHNEVTYSLCSSDVETFTTSLSESYRLISQSLVKGLERMGLKASLANAPPDSYVRGNLPCFSYPARNEIEVDGRKIIGSAQKRVKAKFIQHGSIPLRKEEGFLESVSFLKNNKGKVRMISISQALRRNVSFEWTVRHMTDGISEFFGIKLRPCVFDDEEKKAIFRIQKERYANNDWTLQRKQS